MHKEKIYIWGAALIGNLAYHYFKDECEIIGYLDNNSSKWGGKLNDLYIFSPDILKENSKVSIVIAVESKVFASEICSQIRKNYKVEKCIHFTFKVNSIEDNIKSDKEDDENFDMDTVLVCFQDGLGNQMFQYVIYRTLELQQKNVLGDLSYYKKRLDVNFELTRIFKNIDIKIASDDAENKMVDYFLENNNNHNYFKIYKENVNRDNMTRITDKGILDIDNGIIKGFHQDCHYAANIRDDLLRKFVFFEDKEKALHDYCCMLRENMYVSVHIRRGDYLNSRNYNALGSICSTDYYKTAINYIKKRVDNPKFVFFSDEIEWVKNNIYEPDALYLEKNCFEDYQDWYDMCLMSCCNHNIIANSTFSWWGAWLNRNEDKIVIAPKMWMNHTEVVGVCPDEWIRV